MNETAFVASIRTRVGQIKKANNNASAGSWHTIELACDKLLAEADTFERAYQREHPEWSQHGANANHVSGGSKLG